MAQRFNTPTPDSSYLSSTLLIGREKAPPTTPWPLPDQGPLPGRGQCDKVARSTTLESDAPGFGPALALTSCVTLGQSPHW